MYHKIFCACVDVLEKTAAKINRWLPSTKMDYTKINVLIFCVIWPIITIGLLVVILGLITNPGLALAASKLLLGSVQ
jgi:hypothetical protein